MRACASHGQLDIAFTTSATCSVEEDMDLLLSWDLMLKRHILHEYSSLWWLIQIWLSQTIVSEVPTWLLTDWKSCCSADPDM